MRYAATSVNGRVQDFAVAAVKTEAQNDKSFGRAIVFV